MLKKRGNVGSEVGAEIETPEDPDMEEMIVVAGKEYFNSWHTELKRQIHLH